jgi:two-component system chemotaxis sensor kinase CheA
VDAFLAERAELIHDIGITSGISRNLAGAMLQRDGTVSLVLNPAGLVDACGRIETPTLKQEASTQKPPVRILVVDDSITTRQLEKNALEASGYSVQVAVDGIEALEKIKAEKPSLVISDIEMPRMSGFELLAAIQADGETRDIPVIIVSSLEKTEDQAKGLALGAAAYIVKGKFDQHELLEAITQIL